MEYENLITRINYSTKARGYLGCLFFGTLGTAAMITERLLLPGQLPHYMQGRLLDLFATPFCASLSQIYPGETSFPEQLRRGFLSASLIEVSQIPGLWGTFDLGDFAAYGAGGILWAGFHLPARKLYNSGRTKPLYQLLRIQDRRLNCEALP